MLCYSITNEQCFEYIGMKFEARERRNLNGTLNSERLCIIMWVSTSPGEYRYEGFFEVAGGGRALAPPTAGNAAV